MKKPKPLALDLQEDLAGKKFAFFGAFARWPATFGVKGPREHVTRHGARVVPRVPGADYLVLGDKPGPGKKAARDAAARLQAKGEGPRVLDEREFLHLVRPRLEGRRFLFAGGFSRGLDVEGPAAMVEADGAVVVGPEATEVDFLVVGPGRQKGKADLERRVQATCPEVRVLDEEQFVALLACVRRPQDAQFDVRALALHLRSLTDPKKVERGVQMLKQQSFHLYSEATPRSVGGIVKSQTLEDAFYACWIGDAGRFGCFDAGLQPCMGQGGGQICKHLVVLMLGLAAAGQLDPRHAFEWARIAADQWPLDKSPEGAELLLRYRAAQAGEVDWRPTETLPEDYYAL
ncbi:MAG: hypothetical protein KJ067_09150 [Vicinamibacteria bacterium]|nr:hypothetical protein [Vicinamibacteria bacterium]